MNRIQKRKKPNKVKAIVLAVVLIVVLVLLRYVDTILQAIFPA